jgi:hypothetical protein
MIVVDGPVPVVGARSAATPHGQTRTESHASLAAP